MAIKRKITTLPATIQLYWKCDYCKHDYEWPQNKAGKYCSDKCKNATYYRRTKEG